MSRHWHSLVSSPIQSSKPESANSSTFHWFARARALAPHRWLWSQAPYRLTYRCSPWLSAACRRTFNITLSYRIVAVFDPSFLYLPAAVGLPDWNWERSVRWGLPKLCCTTGFTNTVYIFIFIKWILTFSDGFITSVSAVLRGVVFSCKCAESRRRMLS